jgi:hypothetical protein
VDYKLLYWSKVLLMNLVFISKEVLHVHANCFFDRFHAE